MAVLASVPALARPGRSLSDRVMALLERVDYRRADTAEDREAIFRLRYAAYRREEAIPHSQAERFSDALGDADNAWTFGVYIEGELASSIRLHVANRQRPVLPARCCHYDFERPPSSTAIVRTLPRYGVAGLPKLASRIDLSANCSFVSG